MDNSPLVYEALDRQGIPYDRYDHSAAHTIADCLSMPFITPQVVICKNIFLCNRQKTQFYLMLITPQKVFHTAHVSKALGVSRLSFAPDEALGAMLGLEKGAVSPLGLLLDRDHRITLVCDEALQKAPRIAFHPLVNTTTVIFDGEDFWHRVLPLLGATPVFIACPEN